jgi:hypothetical protein
MDGSVTISLRNFVGEGIISDQSMALQFPEKKRQRLILQFKFYVERMVFYQMFIPINRDQALYQSLFF